MVEYFRIHGNEPPRIIDGLMVAAEGTIEDERFTDLPR